MGVFERSRIVLDPRRAWLEPRGSMLTRLRDLCSLQVPAISQYHAHTSKHPPPRSRVSCGRPPQRAASHTVTSLYHLSHCIARACPSALTFGYCIERSVAHELTRRHPPSCDSQISPLELELLQTAPTGGASRALPVLCTPPDASIHPDLPLARRAKACRDEQVTQRRRDARLSHAHRHDLARSHLLSMAHPQRAIGP